jgi:hypothetical protein
MNVKATQSRTVWVAVVTMSLSAFVGCGRAAPKAATIEPGGAEPVRPPTMKAGGSGSQAERPAWVDAPAGLHGGVYVARVIVGPEPTREACEAKLGPAVESALAAYVAREYAAMPGDKLELQFASLRSKVVGETWEEHVTVGDEDAVFLHAQLKLDDQVRSLWRTAYDRWLTTSRTLVVVQGFAVGLGLLLLIHLVLRFTNRAATAS